MRYGMKYVQVGVGLTLLGLGLATVLSFAFGWDWFLVAIVTLAAAGIALFFLTLTADHPPTWGSGFWSIYIEMSGRGTAGGGLSGMTRPPATWDTQAVVNGLVPIIVAGALLILQTLLA